MSKKSILCICAVCLAVAMLAGVLVVSLRLDRQAAPEQEIVGLEDVIEHDGKTYHVKRNYETVLVMGLDKYEGQIDNSAYSNDQQADFLILYVFDHDNKTCTPIHLNRDTMVDMDVLGVAGQKIGTVNAQLALAHTYGNGQKVSCRNTMNAVSGLLLDARIDHYVSVTMDAVAKINDLVGGVTVEVLEDIPNMPELTKGSIVTLTGEQALRYVRARWYVADSSNLNRMNRQRQYLNALFDQARACIEKDANFATSAFVEMDGLMVTDFTVEKMQYIQQRTSKYEMKEIRDLKGDAILGERFMEFYVDEDALLQLVIDVFYEVEKSEE